MKKIITWLSLLFLLAGAATFYLYNNPREFPKKSGPKQITLNANYHGQKLTITETLYKSVDKYYGTEPKKLIYGSKYTSYVFNYKQDKTVKNLTEKIKAMGEKLGLSDDETMDLATAFIQSIPYDVKKGKLVLSGNTQSQILKGTSNETLGRFPYETLYDNKGICTDKSYLLAAILKEMGYGVSLLTFDKEKHMAVGVRTPSGYTSFNTKYSFLESTNTGFKVGQLPTIDKDKGGAKNAQIDSSAGADQKTGTKFLAQIPQSNFSPPSNIYKVSDGKEYSRIIEITSDLNRIKELIPAINDRLKKLTTLKEELKKEEETVKNAKSETDSHEEKLQSAESSYKANPTPGKYSYYTSIYNDYKKSFNQTAVVISEYNNKVSNYNSKNTELNKLINEYNGLIKKD